MAFANKRREMKDLELDEVGLAQLLAVLASGGRMLIGPRVRDGAIVYAPIDGIGDLPRGFADDQSPAHYRLEESQSPAYFGFAAPAQPLKALFHPSEERLFSLRRSKNGVTLDVPEPAPQPLAIVGARACDLEGLARLDRVMLLGAHPDVRYAVRRKDTLIVAAHCTAPASTCFCASMNTGPRARDFDLALTELVDSSGTRFLLEVGTEAGVAVAAALDSKIASDALAEQAALLVQRAAEAQQRQVDPERARASLTEHAEHAHWQSIADRCLACTNCTASCPTCFCSSVEDRGGLEVDHAERWRRTDSCFNSDFSYLHGGAVRGEVVARYRQWLTHKFSTWYDQFGSSGCVGCGRCITWCPVGIDVTQELSHFARIADDQGGSK
jgi:ferredoxin